MARISFVTLYSHVSKSSQRLVATYLAVFSALAFLSPPSLASTDTVIAVLDSPVDYNHSDLSNVVAKDLMLSTKFIDDDGVEKSWWDLNQQEKAKIEKRIDWNTYSDELSVLNGSMPGEQVPGHEKNFPAVTTYVHGTHVAGIAISAQTAGVRMISFPLNTISDEFSLANILNFDAQVMREKLHRRMIAISNALQQHKVRVVNMSLSSSNSNALRHAEHGASEVQKSQHSAQFWRMAVADADIFASEIKWLASQNPNTVFVLSAGNQGIDLSQVPDHSSTLTGENILKVAALGASGVLASFSNYSSTLVNIAAPGADIESALAGGGKIRLPGTSQAAPFVTRTLAKIFAAHPNFSIQEAITELFSKHSYSDFRLRRAVKDSRALLLNAN